MNLPPACQQRAFATQKQKCQDVLNFLHCPCLPIQLLRTRRHPLAELLQSHPAAPFPVNVSPPQLDLRLIGLGADELDGNPEVLRIEEAVGVAVSAPEHFRA